MPQGNFCYINKTDDWFDFFLRMIWNYNINHMSVCQVQSFISQNRLRVSEL